jgi:hypothetical protein
MAGGRSSKLLAMKRHSKVGVLLARVLGYACNRRDSLRSHDSAMNHPYFAGKVSSLLLFPSSSILSYHRHPSLSQHLFFGHFSPYLS